MQDGGLGDAIDVALVVPRSGPAGIFGPSCEACALLAVEEINSEGGLLGRELRLRIVDGGRAPAVVADEVAALVVTGAVGAVTGWHISAVREELAPRLAGRAPYVYTPLYEGGERGRGVFLAGETPDRQVLPALRFMSDELGVCTWCVVGDDYIWPQISARVVRRFALDAPRVQVLDEVFVPLGTRDYAAAVARVQRSGAQGVLMLLVGSDAVEFNRTFAAAGLGGILRLSPLMEENMLLASGAEATVGLYAAAGFFETLPSAAGLDFSARYSARFGVRAPVLNSPGESCFEGVTLLAQLVSKAGGLGAPGLAAAATGLVYDSPRGTVAMTDNHLRQRVYLARADELTFDVLAELSP